MSPISPFGWTDNAPPAIDAANLEAANTHAGTYTDAQVAIAIAASEQGLVATGIKTAAYSAAPGDEVIADCSAGNVPVTLPNAPPDKTRVALKVVSVNATPGTYSATLLCAGSDTFNVTSGPTTLTFTAKYQGSIAKYQASTKIWTVTATDPALGSPLGAAKLGSDGTVGGPSGSSLTASVILSSQPNTFTAAQTFGSGVRLTVNDSYVIPVSGAATADTNVVLSKAITQSDSSTRPVGCEVYYAADPAVAPVASSDFHGVDLHLVTGGPNCNTNMHLYALEAKSEHGIPETINELYGGLFETVVETTSSAQAQNGYAVKAFNQALGGAKLLGNATSVWALGPNIDTANGSSVGGNAYGVYISGFRGLSGGAVTGTSYGIFIVDSDHAIQVQSGISVFNDVVNISNGTGPGAAVALTVNNTNTVRGNGVYTGQFQGYTHGLNASTAVTGGWAGQLSAYDNGLQVTLAHTGGAALAAVNSTAHTVFQINENGDVVLGIGNAQVANAATDGFVYIPTMAGTPTGTPTGFGDRVPLVYDATANKLWVYNGAWKSAALS